MYAEFFGFRELPFNNTPDPRFFYSTPDHEEALASLTYTVQERKGFVLLTGEVGTGKTLISRLMLRQFGTRISFAHINHAVPSAADLLEAICAELEITVDSGSSIAKVVRRLHDFLLARFAQDMPVVLVLDEAQNLPDEAFELIRTIGNLEADDAKLLQIVIVGQPELQERFSSPSLRQLRQRIFRSFHLSALNRATTEAYIHFRLEVAGASRQTLFEREAIDRIYEYSQGLPRLINTLCDNALLSAYSADRRTIDARFLQTVVDQLMMSPSAALRSAPASTAPVAALPTARRISVPPETDTSEGARNDGTHKRQTFEQLSRIVDLLEHRVAAAKPVLARTAVAENGTRELEIATLHARETAERVHREGDERARQAQHLTEQLARLLEHVRTSYAGVKSMVAETAALKKELTALYHRLGARMEEVRTLLTAGGTALSVPPRGLTQILRSPVSIPLGPPIDRPPATKPYGNTQDSHHAALMEMSRSVAQLQSLVDHRKRSMTEWTPESSVRRRAGGVV